MPETPTPSWRARAASPRIWGRPPTPRPKRTGNAMTATARSALPAAAEPAAPRTLAAPALAGLVENRARFLAFLERRVGARDAAEEILQQAYLRGMARGGGLRAGESAVAWFYRLLRNVLVDHWRHREAERRAFAAHAGRAT